MKKLMMSASLVGLLAGSVSVFADRAGDTYNSWVQAIRLNKSTDPKNLNLIELCHLKKYAEGSSAGLKDYLSSKYTSQTKKDQLSDFRSYIDSLKKDDDGIYLSGLKSELIVRIKAINPNASCLK
jgi:hypothetical protein